MTDAGVFDQAETLDRLGGNAELMVQLAGMFVQRQAGWRTAIADAIPLRNRDALRQAVHRLRSPASNFAAPNLAASLERMESLCLQGDLAGLDAAYQAVESDLAALIHVLEALHAKADA
jgi:HPt (histidine-containing phosphotransfer) domain-containing protein